MRSIEENKKLIERYPFLQCRNDWTGEIIEGYEYTYLDDLPEGWAKTFGLYLCEDLREALIAADFLNEYRVVQVKEKFGSLRWYDNGYPRDSNVGKVIRKYETISEHVCVICGKPDVKMVYSGWISPYCEDCWNKGLDHQLEIFTDKDENWKRLYRERNSYEMKTNEEEGGRIPDVVQYQVPDSKGGWKTVIEDISATVAKIRKDWNVT